MHRVRPAYLALFYPCWWLGQAVAGALPALAASLLAGGPPSEVRLDWSGAFAGGGLAAGGGGPDLDLWTVWTVLGCLAVLLASAAALRRWRPPLLYAAP